MTAALVLNAGSSSLKFSVFEEDGEEPARLCRGEFERIGAGTGFRAADARGRDLAAGERPAARAPHAACACWLIDWLGRALPALRLGAVGHRIVHGGAEYAEPVRASAETLARLDTFVPMAPLHQPPNLAVVRTVAERLPGLPQVLCFDTAFHRTQPVLAQLYALPLELYAQGVRRYGFHGLSYEFIAARLRRLAPAVAGGRVVAAHLGNGASLCAMRDGRSVATTMGFTALDGLPMGTRCGSVDPGVVLYLIQQRGMDAGGVADLLHHRSGLLGLSGVSHDVRELLASGRPEAKQALDYFVHRVGRELGSLAAALGGLDGLVFTAGIGANSAPVRRAICAQAAWLGVELDEEANARSAARISTDASRVSVWVLPTDEELAIAQHLRALLAQDGRA
jgi:acetate kinase